MGLMRNRSWDWLRIRLESLLDMPPTYAPDGTQLPVTRVGWLLNPPKQSAPAE